MAPREVFKWNIVLVWNAFCWRVRIRKISPVLVVFPKPAWQIIFWQTISLYCVGFLFNTLVRPVLDYSQTMKFTWFRDAATQWMQGKVADLESMVSIFDSLHKLTWTCYHNEDIVLQHCLRFTNKLTELLFVGCFVIGVTESPIAVTHLRGCQGRTSPLGPNSFMQDSAKNLQNNRLAHILRELASLSYPREILDLVLKTKVPAAPLKGRMVSSKIQEKKTDIILSLNWWSCMHDH